MNEKHVLVEHSSAINTVIHNTFQSTQRIKFTSFDVSTKYIIFGVNSGGIYIFSRETCQFLKLIPSTHGPANLLLISEDETSLAVAVSTGLVIVLEEFPGTFQQQIFCEHEGSTVTAMKWNGNDLYCGDSSGRVSVITLKNFLTKAMFQPPVACLMHLDSQIVQLDTHFRFLLVSTLTRSLICDTETEKYRQIGKKTRDGFFGACFFNVAEAGERAGSAPQTRGLFQTLAENEKLSMIGVDCNVKIYSARPGARLWQADFQGDVIFTHQFRPSLNQKQSDLVRWVDDQDAGLEIVRFEDDVRVGEGFNFGKIFRFGDKFIVSFRDDGVYVFEPSSSALVFWRRLINVKDVKIVNSFLYVWHRDLEVSIMSLLNVEELILKSLYQKRYLLCGQLCVEFFDEVQALIDKSKKIHLISALESKLDDAEILEKLLPIMQRLQDCAKLPSLEKFKNGIVSVNNIASIKSSEISEIDQIKEKSKKKDPVDIMLEQYKIGNINKNVETSDFSRLMQSSTLYEFYNLLKMIHQKVTDDSNCALWCQEIFLKYLKLTQNFDFDSEALSYACTAYIEINNSENLSCECNFPLPKAHKNVPKHLEISYILLEKTTDHGIFLNKIPYLHRFFLEKISNPEQVQSKLSLVIQYSDPKIIRNLSNKMSYDVWDDSLRLLLKLKTGHCLNCAREIDSSEAIEWKIFGLLMVQSINAINTLKLFKRHSNLLPNGALDDFFYQYCIFSTVSGIESSIFNEIFYDDTVKKQLETSVGGYLRKKCFSGGEFNPDSKPSELIPNCDHCQLPLRMPLVEEARMLNCGHKYHQVCFLYKKKQCTLCDPIL